ncbi:hypothetical protein L2E82_18351 [Cichorium intybus]|uniref:Uncharacterized protein n=1 Tax=Cichorium intybus TaxID=13427 RepID=A0ACB9FB96_CICIN|nr:hypothetical protein L2E82_18351 [Cichorium intybus]
MPYYSLAHFPTTRSSTSHLQRSLPHDTIVVSSTFSILKDKKLKLLDHCLRFRLHNQEKEKENGKRKTDDH